MSSEEVVLVGYSGHGYAVAGAAIENGLNLKYYSEINRCESNPFNLSFLGFEGDDTFEGWKKKTSYILGIGDNKIRKRAVDRIISRGKNLINVFHPDISLSKTTAIGVGNFFAKNVSVPPMVTIGNYNILNTGCIIEHECKIGDAVHIGPGAVVAGNVEVGDFSFVGANAVIIQGVKIGKNVIIGAGSVILKDISDNRVVAGNPGQEL